MCVIVRHAVDVGHAESCSTLAHGQCERRCFLWMPIKGIGGPVSSARDDDGQVLTTHPAANTPGKSQAWQYARYLEDYSMRLGPYQPGEFTISWTTSLMSGVRCAADASVLV